MGWKSSLLGWGAASCLMVALPAALLAALLGGLGCSGVGEVQVWPTLPGSADPEAEGAWTIPSRGDEPLVWRLPAGQPTPDDVAGSDYLQVYVGKGDGLSADRRPIAGRYEIRDGAVRFAPRFDFVVGQDYVAVVRLRSGGGGESRKLTEFSIPRALPTVLPEVTGVFPSDDLLPENVLRFYLHFSTPMQPHSAFDYIQLVDASGNVDDAAFMEFKQELWSEDRRRLTLLMDPGRIKREVDTHRKLGPALRKGSRYRLVVKDGWPTAHGGETLKGFSKAFLVSDPLRERPDADAWEFAAPRIGTVDPLVVSLDRPFDHGLLKGCIRLLSAAGQEVPGTVLIDDHEERWSFRPKAAWVDRRIWVAIDGDLEDVAGNNFRDLLDHSIESVTGEDSSVWVSVELDG